MIKGAEVLMNINFEGSDQTEKSLVYQVVFTGEPQDTLSVQGPFSHECIGTSDCLLWLVADSFRMVIWVIEWRAHEHETFCHYGVATRKLDGNECAQ